ncbi:MAG: flagellar hook-length control protein FliK [Deltaproteobacteria bacterium]|nr:flagellar hook-length control protein FliK [Deltaproteobacteria bacterium]
MTAAAQPAGNAAVASDGDAEPVTARNTAAPKAAAPGSNQNAPDVSRSPVPARTEAVRPSAAADMTQRIERAREIVQRAVSGIVRLGTSGGGRTVIHLHPEHLGRIRLEVNVEKSVASAHLVAENTGVRTLLLHEIATLKDALAQHGIELAQFDVHDGQSHRDASAYDRGQNHGTREKPATAAAKGPAADTIPATPAARHGDGLISVVI